jgi:hypothetical protein
MLPQAKLPPSGGPPQEEAGGPEGNDDSEREALLSLAHLPDAQATTFMCSQRQARALATVRRDGVGTLGSGSGWFVNCHALRTPWIGSSLSFRNYSSYGGDGCFLLSSDT